MKNYVLDDQGNPVEEPDIHKWSQWYSTADKTVARAEIDGIVVSTVFLSIDHAFGDGQAQLYETMIFGGKHDQYQQRYANRARTTALREVRQGTSERVGTIVGTGDWIPLVTAGREMRRC